MNLKVIGANQTELSIKAKDFRGETKILFSYNTPVAALNLSPEFHERFGDGMIRTSKKWSKTTSKHINQWLGGSFGNEVDQEVLNCLVA